jgi:hypothetical protein
MAAAAVMTLFMTAKASSTLVMTFNKSPPFLEWMLLHAVG